MKGECVCDEGYTGKAPDDCQLIGRFSEKANLISQTAASMWSAALMPNVLTERVGAKGDMRVIRTRDARLSVRFELNNHITLKISWILNQHVFLRRYL